MNNKLTAILKWIFLILSYGFITYKLLTFNQYGSLLSGLYNVSPAKIGWFTLVLLFFPLNIVIEALKWQKLISVIEFQSLMQSIKAVLSGFSTGFFTPNRLGEPIGRINYLKKENRMSGVFLSYLSGFVQTYLIALVGLPATIFFFVTHSDFSVVNNYYYYFVALFLFVGIVFYFRLPKIASWKILSKHNNRFGAFTNLSSGNLLSVLMLTFLRYVVFGIQFYGMLRFFGVNPGFTQALISIPANYLFVTLTPTMAFSEGSVRSSYAVFFIGVYSHQTAGIAFAAFAIWLINSGLPVILGSLALVKTNK